MKFLGACRGLLRFVWSFGWSIATPESQSSTDWTCHKQGRWRLDLLKRHRTLEKTWGPPWPSFQLHAWIQDSWGRKTRCNKGNKGQSLCTQYVPISILGIYSQVDWYLCPPTNGISKWRCKKTWGQFPTNTSHLSHCHCWPHQVGEAPWSTMRWVNSTLKWIGQSSNDDQDWGAVEARILTYLDISWPSECFSAIASFVGTLVPGKHRLYCLWTGRPSCG